MALNLFAKKVVTFVTDHADPVAPAAEPPIKLLVTIKLLPLVLLAILIP